MSDSSPPARLRGSSPRCARCRLPERWCICAAHRDLACPLAIDVVMHYCEQFRPSSTGHLIGRLFPDAPRHLWSRERPVTGRDLVRPDRECWILHPQGEPLPDALPADVQIVLLDGSWNEVAEMASAARAWGQLVRLPATSCSRYWLRAQSEAGGVSTVEALLALLEHFGLADVHAALRLQFELHVYASLRSRGHKAQAEAFLVDSPIRAAFPDLLTALHLRRPNTPLRFNHETHRTHE